MKTNGLKLSIALAFFCGVALPVSIAGGEDRGCKEVAAKIAGFAKANDINKISVLEFTGKDGVEKNETDYISERLGTCLAGYKKPALIERELLEKVLKETRLSSAAGASGDEAKALMDIFSIDAVVTGTVFAGDRKLKVLTKLIDVRTGRVLLAAQSESEREWSQAPGLPDIDQDWGSPAWTLPPADLKDAVSGGAAASCSERQRTLKRLNSDLVVEKALYWAAKMKEPGFSLQGLDRNPGAEIADTEVKSSFYKLLGAYYKSERIPLPEQEKVPELMKLLAEETRVRNDCGYR